VAAFSRLVLGAVISIGALSRFGKAPKSMAYLTFTSAVVSDSYI